MGNEFFTRQDTAIRKIVASVTACEPDVFSREGIEVTERPEPPPWPFTGMIVGFGVGLVVCVEGSYMAWAREHVGIDRARANYLAIPLAAEGTRRGETLHPIPPMLGWALGQHPPAFDVPDGYRLGRVDKGWMGVWQQRERFTNALGHAVQAHRRFRNQFGYALFGVGDEPVAVAGVYDTAGLSEIGVDVATQDRGLGLSKIVVAAGCAELVMSGKTPFYECEVRNIRSQRTALASGFMPACSLSVVMAAGMGLVQ